MAGSGDRPWCCSRRWMECFWPSARATFSALALTAPPYAERTCTTRGRLMMKHYSWICMSLGKVRAAEVCMPVVGMLSLLTSTLGMSA